MSQIQSQLQGIMNQVNSLTAENNRLQAELAQAQREAEVLKTKAGKLEVAALMQSLPRVDRIVVPADIRTLGVMALTQLQAQIKTVHAEIDRNASNNAYALAQNRKVYEAIEGVFRSAGLLQVQGERYTRPAHGGPGRFEAVAENTVLKELRAKLLEGDDSELARAQLRIKELTLVGAVKQSTAPKLAAELVNLAESLGISAQSFSTNKDLAEAVFHLLNEKSPLFGLGAALKLYAENRSSFQRAMVLNNLQVFEDWHGQVFGSLSASLRVRLAGMRQKIGMGQASPYELKDLGASPDMIQRFNMLVPYLK